MNICMMCCSIEQARQLVKYSHINKTERELLNNMCLVHKSFGVAVESGLKNRDFKNN
jgi:hypothetical protein